MFKGGRKGKGKRENKVNINFCPLERVEGCLEEERERKGICRRST